MINREEVIINMLTDLDQKEIVDRYKYETEENQKKFIEQIDRIESNYPGGIKEYVKRAKILLENSQKGINPYEGFVPSVPEGKIMEIGNEDFLNLEKIGFDEIKDLCCALVAGGLGERLGYPDIKIGIETELITKRKFIELYIDYILAYESRIRKKFNLKNDWFIPLAIMTSEDTHEKTVKLLKENKNFGLQENQIDIIMQEKYPSLLDNECHFAMQKDKFLLETKPHGHGDIHMLLYTKGIIKKWFENGKKWLVLFQDTNALTFNVVPSALGVSKQMDFCMNSICIPRKPKEAIGAICKLTKGDKEELTINVEYNQLDSLLKSSYNSEGDVANKDGISDFPGNLNILFFKIEPYFKVLQETNGNVSEFVNPKYANDEKTIFKSPTRLECMMQDFPKLLTKNEKVGFTTYDRWFSFSTCKNKLVDAFAKLKNGNLPEAAFSVEQDLFLLNINILKDVLKNLNIDENEKPMEIQVLGEKLVFGPKILIYPSFACTINELKEKIKGKITMTQNSTLIIKNDIKIEKDIYLDGILTIDKDVTEEIKFIDKKRHIYIPLQENEGEIYEKIRGYTMKISS